METSVETHECLPAACDVRRLRVRRVAHDPRGGMHVGGFPWITTGAKSRSGNVSPVEWIYLYDRGTNYFSPSRAVQQRRNYAVADISCPMCAIEKKKKKSVDACTARGNGASSGLFYIACMHEPNYFSPSRALQQRKNYPMSLVRCALYRQYFFGWYLYSPWKWCIVGAYYRMQVFSQRGVLR